MYVLGKRSRGRLKGVHPVIVKIVETALNDENCPHDFGIPGYGGLRTVEDQQELYSRGRKGKNAGMSVVTWVDGIKRKSNHQAKEDGFGYAFDIYIYKNGKASWKMSWLKEVARHIQKVAARNFGIDLGWGGDWRRVDMPHFEYIKGLIGVPVEEPKAKKQSVEKKEKVVEKKTVKKEVKKK